MADVTQTRYALYHPGKHMALTDQPYWPKFQIDAQYRGANIRIENGCFKKQAWYGPSIDYITADEFIKMELDDNVLKKNFRVYKSKNLANNIRKKFIKTAELMISHPTKVKKESYYERQGTNMDLAKQDLKFAKGIEVVEVKYTTDPEELVVFAPGKHPKCIRQKAKGTAANICSGCGMKLKKIPCIEIEKTTSYQSVYLCPICAYNLHKIAEPLYNGMGENWLSKVEKQIFVKAMTDL